MFTLLPPFWLIRVAVAAVWIYEGLWCKLLRGQPHELKAVAAFGRAFAPAVGWSSSQLRAFLDLDDPAEQTVYWRRRLDTWRFRAAFDGLLSLSSLRAVQASPFLDFLPPRLGAVTTRYVSLRRPIWLWKPIEAAVCHMFHRHLLASMRRKVEPE